MLSYRHAYHAGNHADVLKHVVLVALLEHYTQKDKPFWYVDTHAGAGVYRLDRPPASDHREHDGGIGRLWPMTECPGLLGRYLALVRRMNPDGVLRRYPGSPWIAREMTRVIDKLWLFDLHPTEHAALLKEFGQTNVKVSNADGLTALRALLPPAPRRGLVMIDPSYELKSDYDDVTRGLAEALERFSAGTYAVWYPLLASRSAEPLLRRLESLGCARWLHVVLEVGNRGNSAPNLHGSGIYVLNPPHTLPAKLEETLPTLRTALARDQGAHCSIEFEIP